jgi:hypothetical protein
MIPNNHFSLGSNSVRNSNPEDHDNHPEMNVDEVDEDDLSKDRWVVKLHPDCGLVYYTDSVNELSSWTNPFAPGIDNEIFEKINIDSEHKPPPTEEAEKLAGYENVPNREVFSSDYVQSSKSRLTNWIQREHLRIHDDYAAMLNYPEYITMRPPAALSGTSDATSSSPTFVQISIRFPKGLSEDNMNSSFTTKLPLSDSVAKVMDFLFKKYFNSYGRALDEAGTDGYIFKVVGFQEYLLHMDFPLSSYDCAVNAARDKVCTPPPSSLTLMHFFPPCPLAKTGAVSDQVDPRRVDGCRSHHRTWEPILS